MIRGLDDLMVAATLVDPVLHLPWVWSHQRRRWLDRMIKHTHTHGSIE
jgi:hypothetical protein